MLEVFLLFIRLGFELELNEKIDIIHVVQNHYSSEFLSELKSVGVKLLHLVWLHLLQMSHRIPDLTYLSQAEQLGLLELISVLGIDKY